MGSPEDDPAKSGVKKEERYDGGLPPGWESLDSMLEEVRPEEVLPPAAAVIGFIKEEAIAYEPLETLLENDGDLNGGLPRREVVEKGVKDEGADRKDFGEEGVRNGWESAAGSHPSLFVSKVEAPVSGLQHETCENINQEMPLVLSPEELKVEQVGDQVFSSVEGDHYDGVPSGSEKVDVKDGRGTKLPPESVYISKMEDETLKKDPSAVSSGGSLELPASLVGIVMEHNLEEVPPKENRLADDEDGPPPGWEAAAAAKDEGNTVPAVLLGITRLEKSPPRVDQLDTAGEGYDEDGPPPGWEAAITKDAGDLVPPVSVEITTLDIKMEEAQPTDEKLAAADGDIDDDGPPPGWEASVTKDAVDLVPPVSVEITPSEIEMEETQQADEKLAATDRDNNDDGPPPGWEAATTMDGGSGDAGVKQESSKLGKRKEPEEEQLPPVWESEAAPGPPLPSKAKSSTIEMGQVVCGSCRSLLSYSKGAKYVQCSSCQTVSFVLEAHQVGQVYCRRCSVLLMYFYGSPAVRCSGCQFITQIGPENRRPPLSEQGVTLQSQLAQLRPTTNLAR
ncbi:hypothetical protein QQ045_026463 [Rhodiola kirilowii]